MEQKTQQQVISAGEAVVQAAGFHLGALQYAMSLGSEALEHGAMVGAVGRGSWSGTRFGPLPENLPFAAFREAVIPRVLGAAGRSGNRLRSGWVLWLVL